MKDTDQPILHKDGVSYVLPFILVTCCFALWGFANDITNPMVKAFSKIFRMSVTDGALVQVAFYGGYFAMAFPAAMFIRKYSYKAGILLGLGLYAVGALLFFPAKMTGSYYPFLLAYFILTCGLSFLETSSNPYILSMGTEATATRRLNLAQSFNPMGSLLGMYPHLSSFTAGVIMILVILFIVYNFVNSRTGRAVMAIRDNRIAAESVGINITKFKLMAFTISAAIAGAGGVLYAHNLSTVTATPTNFGYNMSIMILVFVVLGGMGSFRGSIIAAVILTLLPEVLRGLKDYRMLIYSIVLIVMMLFNWAPKCIEMRQRIAAKFKKPAKKEAA